ncbi:MAG TPA: GFA family protein [Caulobacteraceae bacterium]|jgi:hypothetical protein
MIRGGCLCGACAFEADALSGPLGHCHCRTCRKAHSAAFATTARTGRAGFRWTAGDDVRRAYESSPGKLRWFCSRCGSQLMAEWTARDEVILRVGAVDDGIEGQRPVAHIWMSDAAAWDTTTDDLPHYQEGAPPRR